MAIIRQIGPGCLASGTIDGIIYYVRNGKMYARAVPIIPESSYNNPAARIRQAIFKMVQMHLKYHLRTIKQTVSPEDSGSSSNRYFKLNKTGLYAALKPLAELYVGGQEVTITDVEQAICKYAADNPNSIMIAAMSGYREVYLTGSWPDAITLEAKKGGNKIIIVVAEKSVTTTVTTHSNDTEVPTCNDTKRSTNSTTTTPDSNEAKRTTSNIKEKQTNITTKPQPIHINGYTSLTSVYDPPSVSIHLYNKNIKI
ncbi:MAG: hypothetical protein Q4D03_05725 [Bacteroidales bacterium]|nr:hypothetical protein [Bacteroidales bacterium]